MLYRACHRAETARRLPRPLVAVAAVATMAPLMTGVLAVQDTPSARADGINLVVNGGFELGTAGWKASGADLGISTGSHTGAATARLTNSTTAARTGALNDVLNTVPVTVAGRTASASAWVRTNAPGTTVGVRLMEYNGSTLVGQKQGTVTLSGLGWQQVSVAYTAQSTGASLDLNVLGWSIPAGKKVYIDDVSLVETTQSALPTVLPPAPPAPPAPPTPPAPPAPPAPAPAGWQLAWSDDFDGTSVDTSKWNVRDQSANSNEQSYLLARNAVLGGGNLTLRAKREAVGGKQYTSAYLDTMGKTKIGIGSRWEIRAKVPTQFGSSQGLWPAFWLRSNEGPGEIDVAEWYGSPSPNLADSYKKVDNIVHESTNGGLAKSGKSYTFPGVALPSDGFHVYAVELLSDGIHFYVDGVQSHFVPATSAWTAPMLAGTWNIRLNFQVGKDGSWASSPTAATSFPADFVVDYVRVFKK